MEPWLSLPWPEIISLSLFLVGSLTGFTLVLTRYPSGRWLGALTLTFTVSLPITMLGQGARLPLLAVVSAACCYEYVRAFFYQKQRVSRYSLAVAVVVVGTLLFIEKDWLNVTAGVLLPLSYLIATIRVLNHERLTRGFSYFKNASSRISWLRNFVILLFLYLVSFVSTANLLVLDALAGVFLMMVLLPVIRESAFLAPIPIGNKYKKSTLNPSIKAAIIGKLDTVMGEERFYLRDDASLSKLAGILGASTHHLSQVLNESLAISFQDLLTQYRIREACRLLKASGSEGLKIENIASSVGYNSKSAFNAAFKKRTGLTPSEYRTSRDVQTYGEVHLSERKVPVSSRPPFHLKSTFYFKMNPEMIQHFFKLFARNVKRNGLFSLLNILGLTIGFTASLLIYLYLSDELSYDRHFLDHERIYRVAWNSDNPQTRTPHPMAQAMVRDLPEVEAAVSFSPWYGPGLTKNLIRVKNVRNNVSFEESDFYFADSTLLDVFSLEVLEGDKEALSKPFSFVISRSLATKYFGDSSALGKELLINDMPLAVSAVIADMPTNSHFHIDGIIPYVTLKQLNPDDNWMTWADFGHFNYIKVKEGVDADLLESKIPKWVAGYLNWNEDGRERLLTAEVGFALQPLTSIHLDSHLRWELEENGNRLYVYILTATLVFLLLIAAINYINLTTSKSIERAKEVGVRKTLGAVTNRLAVQFHIESVLFCLLAQLASFALAALLLNAFNALAGKEVAVAHLFRWSVISRATLLGILIGLVAGAYPAFALSSYRPTEVLKGKLGTSSSGVRIRGALVVVQFTISAVLIAGSLIIMRQIDFMRTTALGFDKDAIISLSVPINVAEGGVDLPALRSAQKQLEALSGVQRTTLVSGLPGGQFNQHAYFPEDQPENRVDASEMMVDFHFEEVFGISILDGRSFDRSYGTDSIWNVLVNETMVSLLNLDDPVGTKLTMDDSGEFLEFTIVGVVEDFHFQSLHEEIQPLVMAPQPLGAAHLVVKLDGHSFGHTLDQIAPVYAQLEQDLPFDYHFLDDDLAQLYNQEERTLRIFFIFALMALILAALGLVGMSVALLNQRIKEIGVRKILGATSFRIMQMVLGQFLRLVLMALLIGLPVAYLVMQEWMQEFSYQVAFGWMPFVWAIIILLLVAALSVVSAVTKITFSNPVEALRYE